MCNVAMSSHLQEAPPLKILHLNIANIYVIGKQNLILYETSQCNLLQHNWWSHGLANSSIIN